jgi:hypothetical protein
MNNNSREYRQQNSSSKAELTLVKKTTFLLMIEVDRQSDTCCEEVK